MLAGVRAYQAHDHVRQLAPMPPLARLGGVTLRDYGGDGTPLMVVPSLINPPHVLDLAEDNSLLRWLATQGLRPLLVDWGSPGADERTLDAAGYVSERLLPLIAGLPVPPLMLGYCLGGTLAIAAAALAPVRRLALIAAPWRFAAYDPAARDGIAALWASVGPAATTLGCMPVELLQPAFWQLDPAALVAKYEQFPRLDAAAAAAYAVLEDWANTGPPLALGVARDLFAWFADDLPGRGEWPVAGRQIDPEQLGCAVLDIVSTRDRIVPAAAACNSGDRLELGLGHVGMVVGGRARAQLWEPLAAWLNAG